MQTLTFDVHSTSCGGCTGSVQRALRKLDGISHAEVILPGTAFAQANPARINAGKIESVIIKLGYAAMVRAAAPDEKVMT